MSYDPTQNPTPEHGASGPAYGGPGYPPPADYPAGLGPLPAGPTPGWDPAPTVPARSNGLAVGGFVCAAVGAVTAFVPYAGILGFPVLAVGLVLCAIGLTRGPLHRGLAVAGLVVALVGLPVDAVVTSATLSTTTTASSSSSPATSSSGSSSGTGTYGDGGSGYSAGSYGSGSSGYPSAGGYSSPSSSGTSSGYGAADQAYLGTLSRYGVTGGSDAQAISLGHSVCSYLSRGGTATGAIDVITDNGFSSTEASVIVGAAEGAYCSN